MSSSGDAPSGGAERTPNAVGCKPSCCLNWCYWLIGLIGAVIIYPGAAGGIIGMWSLGPDMWTSLEWALGPPLMTGAYKADLKESRMAYPPA